MARPVPWIESRIDRRAACAHAHMSAHRCLHACLPTCLHTCLYTCLIHGAMFVAARPNQEARETVLTISTQASMAHLATIGHWQPVPRCNYPSPSPPTNHRCHRRCRCRPRCRRFRCSYCCCSSLLACVWLPPEPCCNGRCFEAASKQVGQLEACGAVMCGRSTAASVSLRQSQPQRSH